MDSPLVSDPQRFMKLVMLDNPRERKDGLKTLDDIVLREILRFGIHNEPATSAAPFLSCFLPLEGAPCRSCYNDKLKNLVRLYEVAIWETRMV